jgi:hypothetical protein
MRDVAVSAVARVVVEAVPGVVDAVVVPSCVVLQAMVLASHVVGWIVTSVTGQRHGGSREHYHGGEREQRFCEAPFHDGPFCVVRERHVAALTVGDSIGPWSLDLAACQQG